jgi:hypothetical protein
MPDAGSIASCTAAADGSLAMEGGMVTRGGGMPRLPSILQA